MESILFALLPRADHPDCTKDTCTVSQSLYGYLPSKVGNTIFVVLFAISCIAHIWQGIRAKSWTFLVGLGIGTILETLGYVGRLLLRNDPFSKGNIGIQLVSLTVAPAFIAAGIYLTLNHLIIIYGSKFSRIQPKWYTRIFIVCDIFSILLQMAGAVMAASASTGTTGNNIMMIGLASQVVTLLVFGIMAMDVFFRIRKFRGEFDETANNLRNSRRYKGLLAAIAIAYFTIFVRCVYRIAEMAGGWKNPIMQDEPAFIVLDGVMCIIAVFVLNVFHPGFLFKQSYLTIRAKSSASSEIEFAPRHPLQSVDSTRK